MKSTLPDREFQECLDRLMSDWTDQFRRGEDVSPQKMCEYCPEFAEALAERIKAYKSEQAKAAFEAAGASEPVMVPPKVGWYELWQQMEFTSIAHQVGDPGAEQVWIGFDSRLSRNVLIRLVPRTTPVDPDHDGFLGQAKRLSELRTQGVLSVTDYGIDGSFGYLVSDQVDGQTLADEIGKGRLNRDRAVALIIQIARIIHHAHSLGYVHGDIRPSNIWIDRDGNPLVSNFSLVAHRTVLPIAARDLSAQGMRYMAPEQILRHTFVSGEKADIYSLGVILFELVIGSHPYYDPDPAELRKNIAIGMPGSLHSLDSTVGHRLDVVCRRALAKSPIQRQSSALQFADELAAAVAPPRRVGSWMLIGAVAGAIAVALGGLLVTALFSQKERPVAASHGPRVVENNGVHSPVPQDTPAMATSTNDQPALAGSTSGSAAVPEKSKTPESQSAWVGGVATRLLPSPLDPNSPANAGALAMGNGNGFDLATLFSGWQYSLPAQASSTLPTHGSPTSGSTAPGSLSPSTNTVELPPGTALPQAPSPRAYRVVDLLQILDPKLDALSGQWQKQNDILRIFNEGYLQVGYEAPGEYDILMDFASTSSELVGLHTPHGDARCWWGITPGVSGIYWLAGNDLTRDANPSKRIFPIADNRIYSLEIHVRNARYTVLMDDKVILDYPIDYRRVANFNLSSQLRPPVSKFRPGSFVLYNNSGVLTVTRLRVREISGDGKLPNGTVPASAIHFESIDAGAPVPSSSNMGPRFISPPMINPPSSPLPPDNAQAAAAPDASGATTPDAAKPDTGAFQPVAGLTTDKPSIADILKLWPAFAPVIDTEWNLRNQNPSTYFARWDINNRSTYLSARDPRSVFVQFVDPRTGRPVVPPGYTPDSGFVLLPQPVADPNRLPTLLGDIPPDQPNGRGIVTLGTEVKTDYDLVARVNVTRGDMPFRIYLPVEYRTIALDFNPVAGEGGSNRQMMLTLDGAPNVQTFYGGFTLKMNQTNEIKARVRFLKDRSRLQVLILVNDRPTFLADGPTGGLKSVPIDVAPARIAFESVYDSLVGLEELKITLDRKAYRDWVMQQTKVR